MTNPDDQAFPRNYAYQNPEAGQSELKSLPGLTKREYFAARAMQGLLAENKIDWGMWDINKNHSVKYLVARNAIEFADALIAELNKKPETP